MLDIDAGTDRPLPWIKMFQDHGMTQSFDIGDQPWSTVDARAHPARTRPPRTAAGPKPARSPSPTSHYRTSIKIPPCPAGLYPLDDEDKQIQVARLELGNFFGERSLLTGEPRSATVTCVTDVVVGEIYKGAMSELLAKKSGNCGNPEQGNGKACS